MTGLLPELSGTGAVIRRGATKGFLRISHNDTAVTIEPKNEIHFILNLSESHEVNGRMNGERRVAKPRVGTITIMPPNSRFEFSIYGSCRVLFATITCDHFERVCAAPDIEGKIIAIAPIFNEVNDRLAKLLYRATAETGTDAVSDIWGELFTSGRVLGGEVSEISSIGGIPPARLRRVEQRIEDDLSGHASLDQLARLAGMSRFHFARQFAKTTGLPPHRYIIRRKLRRAIQLLASPKLKIGDVARLAGFANASHLARHMNEHQGFTPNEFRRHVLP